MNQYLFDKQKTAISALPQSMQAIPNYDKVYADYGESNAKDVARNMQDATEMSRRNFNASMDEKALDIQRGQRPINIAGHVANIGVAGLGAWKAKRNEEDLDEESKNILGEYTWLGKMYEKFTPEVGEILSNVTAQVAQKYGIKLPEVAPVAPNKPIGEFHVSPSFGTKKPISPLPTTLVKPNKPVENSIVSPNW